MGSVCLVFQDHLDLQDQLSTSRIFCLMLQMVHSISQGYLKCRVLLVQKVQKEMLDYQVCKDLKD